LNTLQTPPHIPKLVVLIPAYNEAHAIIGVLERVSVYADMLIIIDDCSNDSTFQLVAQWGKERSGLYLISLPQNTGASGALKAGYILVMHLLEKGMIASEDLVLEIDSDGQHDPKYIPQLRQPFLDGDNVDVVLARRNFSVYPLYKRFGNRVLTLIANLLGGFSYHDVESNFRVTRAKVFPRLLDYFSGYRYSGAFEVGIILASLRYRIINDIVIDVPFYRAGARAVDGLHVLAMGLRAWFKVRFGLKNRDIKVQEDVVLDALRLTEENLVSR
jgi:glycosyltransferase involved in cell wall biosynthesis